MATTPMAKRPTGTGVTCFFFDVDTGKRCDRPGGQYLFCSTAHHRDRWFQLKPEMQNSLNAMCVNNAVNKNLQRWAEAYKEYKAMLLAQEQAAAASAAADFIVHTAKERQEAEALYAENYQRARAALEGAVGVTVL